MKVLLFGFGLIGKERYKALIDLGICMPEDIDIVDINKGIQLDSTPQFDSELFTIQIDNRDEVANFLKSRDLATLIKLIVSPNEFKPVPIM